MKKILVVRLDAIGDLVLNTPFLRELRRTFPHAHVTLLVSPVTAPLMAFCPHINDVISLRVSKPWRPFTRVTSLRRFSQTNLLPRQFDLAVIPRFGPDFYDAVYLAYFSQARYRVGFSEQVTKEKSLLDRGTDQLLTHVISGGGVKHEVERNLDVIRFLGGDPQSGELELWASHEDIRQAEDLLKDFTSETIVAISLGAQSDKRKWPVERFTEICRSLCGTHDAQFVIVGGPSELASSEVLQRALGERCLNLTAKLSLAGTYAVLRHAGLFLGNDSGPAHLAAAAGVPAVVVCCHPVGGDPGHARSPFLFRPWGVPVRVLQPLQPFEECGEECLKDVPHCILQVSTGQAEEAVHSLLDEVSASSGQTLFSHLQVSS